MQTLRGNLERSFLEGDIKRSTAAVADTLYKPATTINRYLVTPLHPSLHTTKKPKSSGRVLTSLEDDGRKIIRKTKESTRKREKQSTKQNLNFMQKETKAIIKKTRARPVITIVWQVIKLSQVFAKKTSCTNEGKAKWLTSVEN